jgi:hypothetical protein
LGEALLDDVRALEQLPSDTTVQQPSALIVAIFGRVAIGCFYEDGAPWDNGMRGKIVIAEV